MSIKRNILIFSIVLNSVISFSQTILTIEGTKVNNTLTGTWQGVAIPRTTPTTFTYKNNSITSVNTVGYQLQAGDETPGNNNNHT